jgi:hypothetical protein
MNLKISLPVLLAVFLFFESSAFAREIRGRVLHAEMATGKLTVSYFDPVLESWKVADVFANPETAYNGVESFSDLIPGQAILIDANEDDMHGFVATAIQVNPAYDEANGPDF